MILKDPLKNPLRDPILRCAMAVRILKDPLLDAGLAQLKSCDACDGVGLSMSEEGSTPPVMPIFALAHPTGTQYRTIQPAFAPLNARQFWRRSGRFLGVFRASQ